MKQLLKVDFAEALGKFENAIKDNGMLLEDVRDIEAAMIIQGDDDEEEYIRLGALGLPTGRYYAITAKVLVPFSGEYTMRGIAKDKK